MNKDLVLLAISVLLSVFFSKGIIELISQNLISISKTILRLDFRSKLKLIPDIIKKSGNEHHGIEPKDYNTFNLDLALSLKKIDKSVRCNISIASWFGFTTLILYLMKVNDVINDSFIDLFKISSFFLFFLYVTYFLWHYIEGKQKKFTKFNYDINVYSRHGMSVVLSVFAIPFLNGNFIEWNSNEKVFSIFLVIIIFFISIYCYRAVSVNRYTDESDLASKKRIDYLNGVEIELVINIIVFSALAVTYNFINFNMSESDYLWYSFIFIFLPLIVLIFQCGKTLTVESIFHYFFGKRLLNSKNS